MRVEKVFIDTSVVLYAVDANASKADVADEIIDNGGFISVQILNESLEVMRRKWKLPWSKVRSFLEYLEASCTVLPLKLETHHRAADIAEATGIRIYDALLIATAEDAGCNILLTEDLNDGQRIGSVTIRNPFIAA